MKKLLLGLACLSLTTIGLSLESAKNDHKSKLSGKVTDKITGENLPGVAIYLPDLKRGTISLSDGTYAIGMLPSSKILVQVSSLGYKLIAENIDLSQTGQIDFELEPAITEISEVVVTGQSGGKEITKTPAPIAIISTAYLNENSGTNIIDALAGKAGVAQITTGGAISKPVIRGLGYNRVVVVHDGIRQEGQQWGDEHGIEIDEFGVSRAEILKGPASLAYGSDAMAGVIHLMSAPTLPQGMIKGNVTSNYQTNNGLIGNSVNFSGDRNGFIWDLRASDKRAHAYQNKYDGPVYNSGFLEHAMSGLAGINRSWGYSHLNISMYQLKPGMVEGERDSLSGDFTKPSADGNSMVVVDEKDLNSYQPKIPFQKINHYKAILDNNFYFGPGNLKFTLGFQQNQRKEFGDASNPDQYGLYFLLNTVNYNLQYSFIDKRNLDISFGISGMWQQSQNKGTEFLVPAYALFDAGIFTILKKTLGRLDLTAGLRADQRRQNGESLWLDGDGNVVAAGTDESTQQFANFEKKFNGFSGSVGGSYQLNKAAYAKLNFSNGFRAPNIAELGSNGVHEGTMRYERGNPDLKPETSFQVDFTAGLNTLHLSSELNLFSNTVNNFIYSRKQSDSNGNPILNEGLPEFLFDSGKAHLYGGEFTLDIHPHPHDWIHFENSFSYVHADLKNQTSESRYLPFIPPFHWNSVLKTEIQNVSKYLSNTHIKAGIDWYAPQNKIFSAYDTETATPGYTLLSFGAGTDFGSGSKKWFSLFVVGQNLTNVAYQSHLSRLKYGETNFATGRTGIFNIGRNISIKLLIPIDFAGSPL